MVMKSFRGSFLICFAVLVIAIRLDYSSNCREKACLVSLAVSLVVPWKAGDGRFAPTTNPLAQATLIIYDAGLRMWG